MDDTPDKLRRNVVVLSAAILAIAFLNLTFKPSATLLGIADVGNLAAWKIWFAFTTSLTYVFLRYQFDAQTEEALVAMSIEFKSFVDRYVCLAGARSIKRHLLGKTDKLWIEGVEAFENDSWRDRNMLYGRLKSVDVQASTFEDKGDGPWKGAFLFEVGAVWEKGEWKRIGGNTCTFDVPRLHRISIRIIAGVRALYSKGAIDVALPLFVAALAGAVSLFRLGFSLGAIR